MCTSAEKLKAEQYLRLIDNAHRAHAACSGEWGKNYWMEVIAQLSRYFGRAN